MKKEKLKAHELCKMFPAMTDTDYNNLVKSLETFGFDPEKPVYTYKGAILDGIHRYTAALELEIDPVLKEYTGDDPLGFVAKSNLVRRHLTPSQAAAVGAEIADMMKLSRAEAGKKGGRGNKANADLQKLSANEKAAEMVGASPRNIAAAAEVKKEDPKEFENIKEGKITVNAAVEKLHKRKTAAERNSEAFEKAVKVIEDVAGEDFAAIAVTKLSTKDVIKLSGLDKVEMNRVKPFIESGWKLEAAMGYKAVTLTYAHTIRQLTDRATAQGGMFSLEIGDFIIDVKRKNKDVDSLKEAGFLE